MFIFIDSTIFMGMHSKDEKVRIACKNFFVEFLRKKESIYFGLEQVGKCDDIIWSNFTNEEQAKYYPFMDHLHTLMDIKRIPYSQDNFAIASKNSNLKDLSWTDKLTISQAISNKGILYTNNHKLLNKSELPVKSLKHNHELKFPEQLEQLYQKSLSLRLGPNGIIPPLITPLNSQGNVDEKSVKKLIEYVKPYSTALMPTLSSGEGWALSKKQFLDMIKFTIKYSNDLPVYAGVELKTTSQVIEYGLLAKKLGVDAIVITTPFNKNISQNDIYKHFKKVKDEVDIPVFVYNEHAISGNSISFETIVKICQSGNIIGIKEASGSAEFTQKLVQARLNVPIFQGWEHLCLESKGVDGYILPLCNLEPHLCKKMLENPTQESQNKIIQLCKKYHLIGEDWYVHLKKELKRREIILTDKVIK